MDRSATLRSLESESNITSSSDTTTSSEFTVRGIGSISGRAIYTIGEYAIHGVENLAILKRIYSIAEILPNAGAMDLKEVERLYKDLFEFSRQDLYMGSIRSQALKILFRRICSRDTNYLVRCVDKQRSKIRKNLLKDLVAMLDPLRLRSAKEGKASDVAKAYKKSISDGEVHSLIPFVEFCGKLAQSQKELTVKHLLEASVLDFLLHAYDSEFYDPFVISRPRALHRTSAFKDACVALIKTIRSLRVVEPAIFQHPVFARFSTLSDSIVHRIGEEIDLLNIGTSARNLPPPPDSSSISSTLLTFPALEPSLAPSLGSPSLASLNFSTESLITEPPLEIISPRSPTTHRPLPPLPFNNRILTPTHLKVNEFGSRFLPHATSPIRCLLALDSGRLLLIGHDDGLSVIDTFPHEISEDGTMMINGPDEAHARTIWHGQSVLQLSFLEAGECGDDGIPQGAVLALVGPSAGTKAGGWDRSIRIYNLTSLTNLAKWAVDQKGKSPLNLGGFPGQISRHSHSRHVTLPRSLKSLIGHEAEAQSGASYDLLLSPVSAARKLTFPPQSTLDADECNPEWDMVDETFQLRWTKDFVSLASNISSLHVVSYALWGDGAMGGSLLAVATKNSIFLYESPATKRHFQVVKVRDQPTQATQLKLLKSNITGVVLTLSPEKYHVLPASYAKSTPEGLRIPPTYGSNKERR
ncbi:hypothetical protein H0H87_006182 [Tephrocybe sp. NHM501043]|nr:hypothetical protein H0H87_006182 [Tephrocybe sp. NHM501043]